jgi:hypothetical protein
MRFLPLVALWLAMLASPAYAADPIMPLDQVQRGMECEGRSVFRGTEIQTFGVEILDVIDPAPGGGPGILFRAHGPLIGETGLGPGFSGSPIYCPDSEGVARNAGAVAAGVEDYGNDIAIATPIEAIVGTPVSAPASARPSTAAERSARPWSLPLTISGIGPAVRRALFPAARRTGLDLLAAPAGAAQVATPTDLQPGSAAGAALSSGRLGISAIGTVAYRDEDRIWAFGHPLDNAGPRSLLLESAFVHAVIGNPHPSGETLGTYKLSSPGTVAGEVTFDGLYAIAGRLGAPPATIPVEVITRGPESVPVARTFVADESPLNYPAGLPVLSLVTPVQATDSAFAALDSATGRSHGRLCLRIVLGDEDRRMGFCNRYVGDGRGGGGPQLSMGGDAAIAASLVEEYDREHLDVDLIRVTQRLDHGLRFATIRSASAPRRVRRGQSVRIRLTIQQPREEPRRVSFRYEIPEGVKPGRRTLRLTGAPADPGEGSFGGLFSYALGARTATHEEGLGESGTPTTLEQLAGAVASIHRYDGIRATFRKPEGGGTETDDELAALLGFVDVPDASAGRPAFRHPTLRIGGSARLKMRIR